MPKLKRPKKPPKPVTHHADTAEHPISKKNDIGPIYQFLGIGVLLVDLGVFVYEKVEKQPIEWPDVVVHAVMFFAGVFLIRPEFVDGWMKSLADKLPFMKFQKTDDGKGAD